MNTAVPNRPITGYPAERYCLTKLLIRDKCWHPACFSCSRYKLSHIIPGKTCPDLKCSPVHIIFVNSSLCSSLINCLYYNHLNHHFMWLEFHVAFCVSFRINKSPKIFWVIIINASSLLQAYIIIYFNFLFITWCEVNCQMSLLFVSHFCFKRI